MSDDEKLYLDPPSGKTHLSFFAYGIFKPGQLAFSKIEKYVKEISYCKINYLMKIMDGVPIVANEKNKDIATYGYLISFKEECAYEAYRIIGETEPKILYYWDNIPVEGKPCNILKGKKFRYGSDVPEFDVEEFKGHKDPFYREALDLIDECLNIESPDPSTINEYEESIKYFFKLQMHYMLLWSAIDRFTSLKYNKKFKTDNIIEFSKEKSFEKSFEENFTENRIIFPTDKLKPFKLYSEDSWWNLGKSMNYYYKVRCNVVHRGKSITRDKYALKSSLKELSNIFKDVLNDTFNIANIDGINFCIPYGLKEVSNQSDSIRIFKRDETNEINGIPDYIIGISSQDTKDSENIFSIDDKLFNIEIINAEDDDERFDIIRHLNDKLEYCSSYDM